MRRHKTLYHWICGKKYGISAYEIIKFTFDLPFSLKGKMKVESIIEDKNHPEYIIVKYRGINDSIYWPKDFNIKELHQVAAELLYKNDSIC